MVEIVRSVLLDVFYVLVIVVEIGLTHLNHIPTYSILVLSLQLALLDKYEEILLKATAAAEDRKLTGSTKYKVCMEVTRTFTNLSLASFFDLYFRSSAQYFSRSFSCTLVNSQLQYFIGSYKVTRSQLLRTFVRFVIPSFVPFILTLVRSCTCLPFVWFRPSFLAFVQTYLYEKKLKHTALASKTVKGLQMNWISPVDLLHFILVWCYFC